MIKLNNLSFNYGNIQAIKNINLEVKKEAITGIIGPNGAGKSTLLRLISGNLQPKEGEIFLENQNLKNIHKKELAKIQGFVPQNFWIDFPFTCFEIVMMGRYPYLKYLGIESKIDLEITEKAMQITKTWNIKDRLITEISGGERQRVILAQVLAQEGKILILDEPTSHLDINFQVEILDLLKRLNQEKKITIIMAIHDLNLASLYCRELILLKKGEIFLKGAPSETITETSILKLYSISVKIEESKFTKTPHITLIPK